MAKPEPAKSFANIITSMCDGSANSHLSEELHALTAELDKEASRTESAQKGKLKLEITVNVDPSGNAFLDYKVKRDIPVKIQSGGHMWVSPGGNLANEKPNQPGLPMAMVPNRQTEEV